MNLPEIANKIVQAAMDSGATQAEVYAIKNRTANVYLDDNIPKICGSMNEFGIGLKYIINKQVGFTSSTLAQEEISDVIDRARSLSRVSSADEKFVSLPEPGKVSGTSDRFYDKNTASIDSTDLITKAMEVVEGATDNHVSVPNGSLRTSAVEYHICNSLGIDAGSKGTLTFGFFTAKSEINGDVGEGVQRCWSREIGSIDFIQLGQDMKSQALSVIKAQPFKDKWDDVVAILAPSECTELMYRLVGFAISGENVNRRASRWADKMGEKVCSDSLTVIDNGRSERGLLSGVVDDEGVPTQKTTIIEKGILQSYLFDSYNAHQVEMKSTGNGLRRTPRELAGRFTIPAACAGTTMEITPSSKSVDDLIGDVKRGIYVEHFAYPIVDPLSGTFSNEIRNGRLIENGELGHPIKYALWVGNLYESIKGDVLVANNPEVHDKRVMPTLGFPDTEVVGQ